MVVKGMFDASLSMGYEPVLAIRGLFISLSLAVLTVNIVPAFRNRFLEYGSRASIPDSKEAYSKHEDCGKSLRDPSSRLPNNVFLQVLDTVAALRVPHSWFMSFYVVSVSASLFWASQIVVHGPFFTFFSLATRKTPPASTTVHQVVLTWSLMLLQGCRRLYECLTLSKPSTSKMWIGHWILGILFYLAMNVAVWVEGASAFQTEHLSFRHLTITAPSLRTSVCLPLFLVASGIQHDVHAYLASLKTYSLPNHPTFHTVVCPHYLAECIIYLSFVLIAAPNGHFVNWTIATGLAFVTVNLGITASGTKLWYAEKFGEQSVRGRWKMVPWIY
ncbi:putative 3-oxo-5-alpha-steroid 4-dehydrogenase [Cryomyces antarcticus]